MKREAKALIDEMTAEQLKLPAAFLAFVKQRRPDRATAELLKTPGFAASCARGMQDIRAGRTEPWRKVRSDV